jgi:hypothetical protein
MIAIAFEQFLNLSNEAATKSDVFEKVSNNVL